MREKMNLFAKVFSELFCDENLLLKSISLIRICTHILCQADYSKPHFSIAHKKASTLVTPKTTLAYFLGHFFIRFKYVSDMKCKICSKISCTRIKIKITNAWGPSYKYFLA